MTTYAALPMAFKTLIAAVLFLTMVTGISLCIFIGKKQGAVRLTLLCLSTAAVAVMLVLYASVIPAERAKPHIPEISLWFSQQPVVFPLLVWFAAAVFGAVAAVEERSRRRNAITGFSIKESLDLLKTGLCFSYPNGLVMLTNHRMNELSHAIFGTALQNANLFWDALTGGQPGEGVQRIAAGERPEFRLADGAVWSFRRELLDGVIQISAAETTRQHQLVDELRSKHRELEEMNERIRSYGDRVDEYVIARERLETRINLHGFLGQALLMTRHYLLYDSGDPEKIIGIWQRNIDVLRMEAEPQQDTDSLASLQKAALAIGMQVTVSGVLPSDGQIRKLIASTGAETLTNAVRYAGARQLWIDVEETAEELIIRYTNDGAVPAGPVTEGGGLSTARRKIEAAGGRMQIAAAPRFMLTMRFQKEVTRDV